MQTLLVLLPIVWALVATGIALLLYKTSATFFESKEVNATRTKRIRATGSVVIAGAAFFGMWVATPSDHVKKLARLHDLAQDVDRASLAIGGCDASACQHACTPEVHRLRESTTALVQELAAASN